MAKNTKIREDDGGVILKSPKKIGEYMHATRPSVWIVLLAIALLLLGFLQWAIFGTVELSYSTKAYTDNGVTVCWIDYMDAIEIEPGAKVLSSNNSGKVVKINDTADSAQDVLDIVGTLYIREFALLSDTNYYRVYIEMDKDLPDGVIDVKIIEGTITPGQYVFNLKGE